MRDKDLFLNHESSNMEEHDDKIQKNPVFILLYFLTVLIVTIIALPFQLIRFLIKNIILIIILSFLVSIFTNFGFVLILGIVSLGFCILSIILDFRLTKKTFRTHFYTLINKFRFSSKIHKHRIGNEKFNASLPITMGNKKYVVIEYGKYKIDPRDEEKLTGFLVLNYDNGEYIEDSEIRKEMLKIYLMWRYVYFNPVLGKEIKTNKSMKLLIKNRIKFQKNIKKAIEDWSNNNYQKARKKFDKKFIEILKYLDAQVLEQYPLLMERLEHQLWVIQNIYTLFEEPSYELYGELYQKINRMRDLADQENKIWGKRLATWKKLYSYKDLKIRKIPEPNFRWFFTGVFGDLIDYLFLESKFVLGGGTIAGVLVEGGKKLNKETRKLLNKIVNYQMFGINAIGRNIEANKRFEKIWVEYKRIWNNPPVSKIRIHTPKN